MLEIKVHPEVYNDLEQAGAWYENQAKGLGTEFLDEVEHAINLIQQFPDTLPPYSGGTRRLLIHRFPFAIIYRHDKNKIRVFALMHLRRKPGYWKDRKF